MQKQLRRQKYANGIYTDKCIYSWRCNISLAIILKFFFCEEEANYLYQISMFKNRKRCSYLNKKKVFGDIALQIPLDLNMLLCCNAMSLIGYIILAYHLIHSDYGRNQNLQL